MNKFLMFVGATVLGWVGWALGDPFGLMAAFLISSLGSLIGIYAGWRINRDYF